MLSFSTWYESSSDGTNSPWYEQSRRVRTVHGTNSPWYEQSKTVRIVHGTNSPRRYEQSTVRTVQGTNSPSMVRIVQGTNSPRYEKSRYRVLTWCVVVNHSCSQIFFSQIYQLPSRLYWSQFYCTRKKQKWRIYYLLYIKNQEFRHVGTHAGDIR